jgi:hypothetical protein
MKKLFAILAVASVMTACNNDGGDSKDAPKADSPKVEAPKMDSPKVEAPKMDSPKAGMMDKAKDEANKMMDKAADKMKEGVDKMKEAVKKN